MALKTIREEAARDELMARLRSLRPDKPALWGKFTCPLMLAHVADGMQMALGHLPVKVKNTPLRYWPLKHLILYRLPFPRGAPTAPELLARPAQSIEEERKTIDQLLREFVERSGSSGWPPHPAFGDLDEAAWGILQYKHIDHHLRQFGS